jgi:hypothetical protein
MAIINSAKDLFKIPHTLADIIYPTSHDVSPTPESSAHVSKAVVSMAKKLIKTKAKDPAFVDGKTITAENPSEEVKAPPTITTISKMKKWPDDPAQLLSYNDIAIPIKDILRTGYRLFRRDEVKSFNYEGYNIGKQEFISIASPRLRLTEKFLEHEKKNGHNLIDVVLNIMFLMGVEQGRRAEKKNIKPTENLIKTLEVYRERNKDQRIRIDELEVMLEVKEKFPNITEEEFNIKVKDGTSARRMKRIEELKAELKLDATRSSFEFKTPVRAKFKELESLSKILTKDDCTEEQWKTILVERGWTYKQWKDKCKKKSIETIFS